MMKLRPIPRPVWLITTLGAIVTAAAVATQHYLEATGGDQTGLLYPVLAGIVPVLTWLAVGITDALLVVTRSHARQREGILPEGWTKRVLTSLVWMLVVLLFAVLLVGILWFVADLWIGQVSAEYSGAGDEFTMPRTAAVVFGMVFAPGITGVLPAVLLAASSVPTDED